jgi:hypothetical protein
MIQGGDISANQWRRGLPVSARRAMLDAGMKFLIARVCLGTQPDTAWALTRKRATAKGGFDAFGGYGYLVEAIDAKAQAETFMTGVQSTGGVDGCITALDIEDDNTGPITNHPSVKSIEQWVKAFRDVHPVHMLGAYSNDGTWFRLGNPDFRSLGFDYVWQADYRNNAPPFPPVPPVGFGGSHRPPLWQYGPFRFTSNGTHHAIDGDIFYGSPFELEALGGTTVPVPDHSHYIAARNDELDAINRSIGNRPPADGSPMKQKGINDARDAASAAVLALKTGG